MIERDSVSTNVCKSPKWLMDHIQNKTMSTRDNISSKKSYTLKCSRDISGVTGGSKPKPAVWRNWYPEKPCTLKAALQCYEKYHYCDSYHMFARFSRSISKTFRHITTMWFTFLYICMKNFSLILIFELSRQVGGSSCIRNFCWCSSAILIQIKVIQEIQGYSKW